MYLPEWEMTFHLLRGSIYLINYQRKGVEGKAFLLRFLQKGWEEMRIFLWSHVSGGRVAAVRSLCPLWYSQSDTKVQKSVLKLEF